MRYCKIVKVETEMNAFGYGNRWVLTHVCGRVTRRFKMWSRRTGEYIPPPKRVKCDHKHSHD